MTVRSRRRRRLERVDWLKVGACPVYRRRDWQRRRAAFPAGSALAHLFGRGRLLGDWRYQ